MGGSILCGNVFTFLEKCDIQIPHYLATEMSAVPISLTKDLLAIFSQFSTTKVSGEDDRNPRQYTSRLAGISIMGVWDYCRRANEGKVWCKCGGLRLADAGYGRAYEGQGQMCTAGLGMAAERWWRAHKGRYNLRKVHGGICDANDLRVAAAGWGECARITVVQIAVATTECRRL